MADEFDQYTRKPQSSGQDEFAQYARKPSDDSSARHGATGSWGGLVEGAVDAVSAPFKAENWKSLTDNPIVNPYLAQPHDMVTPSDVKDIGRMPSRYEVGNMVGNAVMAGAPEILGSGIDAALPRPVNLADGDVRSPGFGSRIVAGVKAGGPDVAKGIAQVGGAGLLDMATPSSARMVTGFGTLPLVRSGLRDIGRGVKSGMGEFRGPAYGPEIAPKDFKPTLPPMQGPEIAPKGFVSPYDTFSKYEPPMPPVGPRRVNTLPSGRMAPVLPFSGSDFTPTALDRQPSIGKPGAVLPSGSIVGPASPSRVNPPEPRGNAPRVPLRVQMGIRNAQGPEPLPDLSPIYPASPVLLSGRSFGPRPSLGESSPGVVINSQPKAGVASGTVQIANPSQLTPTQPIAVAPKNGPMFSNSSPHAGPYGVRQTLGTQAEMLRQNRLARGMEVDDSEPVVTDTPASIQERATRSRAKFDANGNRNQIK